MSKNYFTKQIAISNRIRNRVFIVYISSETFHKKKITKLPHLNRKIIITDKTSVNEQSIFQDPIIINQCFKDILK
jgi:hypothetical protein